MNEWDALLLPRLVSELKITVDSYSRELIVSQRRSFMNAIGRSMLVFLTSSACVSVCLVTPVAVRRTFVVPCFPDFEM